MQVFWGLPGLRQARVADAVFASCALPGIFPPREIDGRWFVDGAVTENMPVQIAAAQGEGPVMAVDVGATSALRSNVQHDGFAATYIRGLEIVMQTMMESRLRHWTAPPLVLVHPRVEHVSLFAFGHNRELIEEGYRATADLLDQLGPDFDPAGHGIHPQRKVQIRVDRERCVGCSACVMHAPWVFELDEAGRAVVRQAIQSWSPLDGAYVRNCPTYAISARLAPPARPLNAAAASASSRTTRGQPNSRSTRARAARPSTRARDRSASSAATVRTAATSVPGSTRKPVTPWVTASSVPPSSPRHHGDRAGLRLEQRQPEPLDLVALLPREPQVHRRRAVEAREILLRHPAQPADVRRHAESVGLPPQPLGVGARAGHHVSHLVPPRPEAPAARRARCRCPCAA
jgi:ferredoxin